MARELRVRVKEEHSGDAVEQTARELDHLTASTGNADKASKDYSHTLTKLEQDIATAKQRVAELGVEFANTRDKATGKDLRGERSLVAQLEKIATELKAQQAGKASIVEEALGLGQSGGQQSGASFTKGFAESLSSLPGLTRGAGIAAAVTLGAALSPLLGAAVAGAVTGAVGLGGIAGGIFAASHDPGVIDAANSFSSIVSKDFFAAGGKFVQPVIESLHMLGTVVSGLDLEKTFAKVVPWVNKLAEGIAGLATRFWPGFNDALDKSGPLIEVIATQLPEVGAAIGTMLSDMAGSKGTVEGLNATFILIEQTILGVGKTVAFLSDAFAHIINTAQRVDAEVEGLALGLERTFPPMILVARAAEAMRRGLDALSGTNRKLSADVVDLNGNHIAGANASERAAMATRDEAEAFQTLKKQLADAIKGVNDFIDAELGVDQANLGVQEGLLQLRQTLKENGKHWDENTAKGQANRRALLNQVQALNQQRLANIAAGMDAAVANKQFNSQLLTIEALARKAGITEKALQDLAGSYKINVDVSITVAERLQISRFANVTAHDRRQGLQHGGPLRPWGKYLVGEGGMPELIDMGPPGQGGFVTPLEQMPPSGGTQGRRAQPGAGGIDYDALGRALARALHGTVLTIDDRSGRSANLATRGA